MSILVMNTGVGNVGTLSSAIRRLGVTAEILDEIRFHFNRSRCQQPGPPVSYGGGVDYRDRIAARVTVMVSGYRCSVTSRPSPNEQFQAESLRVYSLRLAAKSSYRRKPVFRKPDWIPC
jgi:hypothetical protein